ncbi:PDZ domain-containing protein [Paenibacillus psychroresistens]|uniref:PDZ domain-containing protein n=1 Tax=Paenibacillus psychroresistens TaxID=1778678 RepID=A0A6B8RDI7_9BACL|nr:S41 family peptidase [Paenibacillus psychroresistens]QGQ93552.1 PDZ domain-containing protein [Paenibacillus psychroresistens]
MVFKGRMVLAYVLIGMFASSLLTLLTINFFYPVISINAGSADKLNPTNASRQQAGLTSKDLTKLQTAYNLIHNQYVTEIDHDKILNGAITGMLSATGDPFSTYMTPDEAKQFQDNVDALFEGIGAELLMIDNKITIDSLIKGSPAEKVGLRKNDIIVSVNGEKLEGLTLYEAVAKIRGAKGTQAELSIIRAGSIDPIDIIVVRDEIETQTVQSEMVTKEIGKIEIRQFSARSTDEFKANLLGLEKQGMKSLIIDVRDDPGGLLFKVLEIVEPFIDKGKTIVQVEDRNGKRQADVSNIKEPVRKYPIVVLINKGSASAAEILAAALQQSAGSKLIGETTYGKGTVQEPFLDEMVDGSNIKLTINKWLTPNGSWIHQKGITPDIAVEQPDYFDVMVLSKKETLKFDMNNADIMNMQIMLEGLGFSPERKDGYYDMKTVAAVGAFQKANLLAETGEANEVTMKEIENKISDKIKDSKNDLQLKAAIDLLQSTPAS